MTNFEKRLWEIDAESGWTAEEVQAPHGELLRMENFLKQILMVFREFYPDLKDAYIALVGYQDNVGWFQPISALVKDPHEYLPMPSVGGPTPVGLALAQPEAIIPVEPERLKVVIKLEAHGEFFGFICLIADDPGYFKRVNLGPISDALPVLSHTIADAVFSMRLRILASPFDPPNGGHWEKGIYQQIVDVTARGFAADGSVLRLLDPETQLLKVAASCGEIPEQLLVAKKLGDGITGRLFANPDKTWALFMPADLESEQKDTTSFGLEFPPEVREENEAAGVRSCVFMRLTSEIAPPQLHQKGLGTLSFFHRRPHRYSWREIAAFKTYCQRVADTISLHRINDDLEESLDKLKFQSQAWTRVELVALLVHDLGHKAFAACKDVDDYIERCRKSMNDRSVQQTHKHLDPYAEKARQSTLAFQSAINQIRLLYKAGHEERDRVSDFDLREVLKDVQETLASALERYGIEIDANFRGPLKIHGQRSVLLQAIMNLFINAMESIRLRKSNKTHYIHIHASLEEQGGGRGRQDVSRRVVIQFWDDGPGIDRQKFPDPNKIFELGQTSKVGGTGTGLPVSRSLLGRYFEAQLTLEDRANARFRITVPVK